jgi:hypothetical protein
MIAAAGHDPLAETSVEVVGSGDLAGEAAAPGAAASGPHEALVKIAARHSERDALQILAGEIAPMGLVAQGMTGLFAGRPRPAPVVRLLHVLVDKADVPARVELDGEVTEVDGARRAERPKPGGSPLPERDPAPVEGGISVPLRRVAWARSGDKGNNANIGVIARRPEFARLIREQVTAERVAAVFGRWLEGPVHRYELPGLNAINVVLHDVLGGSGGTSSLRFDPQGKTYGAILLDMPIEVPVEWERDGLLAKPR